MRHLLFNGVYLYRGEVYPGTVEAVDAEAPLVGGASPLRLKIVAIRPEKAYTKGSGGMDRGTKGKADTEAEIKAEGFYFSGSGDTTGLFDLSTV